MALFRIIKHDRKKRIQQANLATNERHNYCFIYSGKQNHRESEEWRLETEDN